MNGERIETEWVGKHAVECRLLSEGNVVYRGERLTGAVLLRGRPVPDQHRSEVVEVDVRLRCRPRNPAIPKAYGPVIDTHRLGRVPALTTGYERALPFALTVPWDALATPGFVVATVHSGRWPRRRVTRAVLPVRIGPERTAEELIMEIASLADASARAWNAGSNTGVVRARFSPSRNGARYTSMTLAVRIHQGRARGSLEVISKSIVNAAYEIDLQLADRREYREALWKCLSPHVDLSGQFPIPALDSGAVGQRLPRPAGPPTLTHFELPRSPGE